MKRLLTAGLLALVVAQPAWSKEPVHVSDFLSLESGHVISPGQVTIGVGLGSASAYALHFRYGVGHSELSASTAYWQSATGTFPSSPNVAATLGWKHALYLPVSFSTAIQGRIGYSTVSGLTGLLGLPLTWAIGPGDLTFEPAMSWQRGGLPFVGLGYQWNLTDQWQVSLAAQTYARVIVDSTTNQPETVTTVRPQLGVRYAPTSSLTFDVTAGEGGHDPEYPEQIGLSLGARYAF